MGEPAAVVAAVEAQSCVAAGKAEADRRAAVSRIDIANVGDVFGGAALGGLVTGLIESGYSRDAEAAADFIAVTALNQLGLTARPLADFVERIEKETPLSDIVPSFLNTHPGGAERGRDIRELSQGAGRTMSGYEWETLRKICE